MHDYPHLRKYAIRQSKYVPSAVEAAGKEREWGEQIGREEKGEKKIITFLAYFPAA